MRRYETFNGNWIFAEGFAEDRVHALQAGETVRLPHSAVEVPYNYFDETCYQKAFTYQKVIAWEAGFEGREVSLVFDGAMADSVVWLNGETVIAHKDGYTPFEARLTPHLKRGDNLLTVKIDGGAPVKYVHVAPHRSAHAAYTGHMAGLDVARNGLRAWAVTSGNEVIDRPYETWKDGIDKSFTPEGTYDIYWAVKQ